MLQPTAAFCCCLLGLFTVTLYVNARSNNGAIRDNSPWQTSNPNEQHNIRHGLKHEHVRGKCPTGATGRYHYPSDCKRFLNCWKGRGILQICAPGTLFNPETLECDHPSKVNCLDLDGYMGDQVPLSHVRFPEERPSIQPNPRKYSRPESQALVREHAEVGTKSASSKSRIKNVSVTCEPGATGHYPHPTNCRKFLHCWDGRTFIKDCAPGTMFNPNLGVCDFLQGDCALNKDSSNIGKNSDFDSVEVYPEYELPHAPNTKGPGVNMVFPDDYKLPSEYVRTSAKKSQCPNNEFECTPLLCIPNTFLCDGEEDCPNGVDEKNCSIGTKAPSRGNGNSKQMKFGPSHWSKQPPQDGGGFKRPTVVFDSYGNLIVMEKPGLNPNQPFNGQPISQAYPPMAPHQHGPHNHPPMGPYNYPPMGPHQHGQHNHPPMGPHQHGQHNHPPMEPHQHPQNPYFNPHLQNNPSTDPYANNNFGPQGNFDEQSHVPIPGDPSKPYPNPPSPSTVDNIGQQSNTLDDFENLFGKQPPAQGSTPKKTPPSKNSPKENNPYPFDNHYGRHPPQGLGQQGSTQPNPNQPQTNNNQGNPYAPPTSSGSQPQSKNPYDPSNGNNSGQPFPSYPNSKPSNQPYPGPSFNQFGPPPNSDPQNRNPNNPNYPSQSYPQNGPQSNFPHGGSQPPIGPNSSYPNPGEKNPQYPYFSNGPYAPNPNFPGSNLPNPNPANPYNPNGQYDPNSRNPGQPSYNPYYPNGPNPGTNPQNTNKPYGPYAPNSHSPAPGTSPQNPYAPNTNFLNNSTNPNPQNPYDPYNPSNPYYPLDLTVPYNPKPNISPPLPTSTVSPNQWPYGRFDPNYPTTNHQDPTIPNQPRPNVPNGQNLQNPQSQPGPQSKYPTINQDPTNPQYPNQPWPNVPNGQNLQNPESQLGLQGKYPESPSRTPPGFGTATPQPFPQSVPNVNPNRPTHQIDNSEEDSEEAGQQYITLPPPPKITKGTKGGTKKVPPTSFPTYPGKRPTTESPGQRHPLNREPEPEEPLHLRILPPEEPSSKNLVKKEAPPSGQKVRLRGGTGSLDGYLEVRGPDDKWGLVCDDPEGWNVEEASVICRELGFSRGAEFSWQGYPPRPGAEEIHISADKISCYGDSSFDDSCNITYVVKSYCNIERDAVGLRCYNNVASTCQPGETRLASHCYSILPSSSGNDASSPREGKSLFEAYAECFKTGGHLLDLTTQAENDFISEWLLKSHPNVTEILTSGVGITFMGMPMWIWQGTDAPMLFQKWWTGWSNELPIPQGKMNQPSCLVMKRKFPCPKKAVSNEREDLSREDSGGEDETKDLQSQDCVTDYFFWDAQPCNVIKGNDLPFVCERPISEVGCVEGRGEAYTGTANTTASGLPCLPWNHPKAVEGLKRREVARVEALSGHNYCRNLGQSDRHPWCFVDGRENSQYCDIPHCNVSVGGVARSADLRSLCPAGKFECKPGECVDQNWICDGEKDCSNGVDEKLCAMFVKEFNISSSKKLAVVGNETWNNVSPDVCAKRCLQHTNFTCLSFNYNKKGRYCSLLNVNQATTGSLKKDEGWIFYERHALTPSCDFAHGLFACGNGQCVNVSLVCDGKKQCTDGTDEGNCSAMGYQIRLVGSDKPHEGRVEIKFLGIKGAVCDDMFDLRDAEVVCRELGFKLGAAQVSPHSKYPITNPTFLIDDLDCLGNETSLRQCRFGGWGKHNCGSQETVGVVCQVPGVSCPDDQWQCKRDKECIPLRFKCDHVRDCDDGSDEDKADCNENVEIRLAGGPNATMGRLEVKRYGVWGTVCDDDFADSSGDVICRQLGHRGTSKVLKNAHFGPGTGPIWTDQVLCSGKEKSVTECHHSPWGQNNCKHNEDVSVICNSDSRLKESIGLIATGNSNKPLSHLERTKIAMADQCFDKGVALLTNPKVKLERIVGPSKIPSGPIPYQASIYERTIGGGALHWCGAIVISPYHVLSAAHCFGSYNEMSYFVRIGDFDTEVTDPDERDYMIEHLYIHEQYNNETKSNDIALLKTREEIKFGANVQPVCLAQSEQIYTSGVNCTVSGWGYTKPRSEAVARTLRVGKLPLLDPKKCREIYKNKFKAGMICAGHLRGGTDTCDGDSGGPLTCRHKGKELLFGITSVGSVDCGSPDLPGVYTNTAFFLNWIKSKIEHSFSPDALVRKVMSERCNKTPRDQVKITVSPVTERIARVVTSSVASGPIPFQASIRVRTPSGSSSHWCGAVILSPYHVLTAAHCLRDFHKAAYFVRVGDYDTEVPDAEEKEYSIEHLYTHPNLSQEVNLANDIALIKVKEEIKMGDHVQPACLAPSTRIYTPGLNCTISGWGSISRLSEGFARTLHRGQVPLLDPEVCKAPFVYGNDMSAGMICAGDLAGGTDSCQGDSGGPLTCIYKGQELLFGLVSWGHSCGKANKPGVYTNVAFYLNWIEEKIRTSVT